jgi:hypothetical protein
MQPSKAKTTSRCFINLSLQMMRCAEFKWVDTAEWIKVSASKSFSE